MAKRRVTNRSDDAEAFREAMKGVQRLPERGRVVHAPARPEPHPRQRLADDRRALQESLSEHAVLEPDLESGEALSYLRAGLSPQVLRKLRSGFWSVQDELDLHGLRAEQARELLNQFVSGAAKRGQRCLRIVHGKGSRSRNSGPVLKRKVASWLAQRGEVLAYCEARPAQGGGGAVVVLLRGQARAAPAAADPEA
jgi:DNA-nicking Smr family endonuclease